MHDGALLDFGGLGQARRKSGQGLVRKHAGQRRSHPELRARLCQHLDGQQRVPTKLKEVVVPPDSLDPQQVLPDGRQCLLVFALRRFVPGKQVGARLRDRQGAAIKLTVGGQGPFRQVEKRGGHHMCRQAINRMLTQLCGCHRCGSGVKGHQAGIGRRLFVWQHHGFLDCRNLCQTCFDLAGLDPKSTQLELEVIAAEVFQLSIVAPAC
ncbi:hypothetical protein D3C87_1194190 [compost metagenome]